jgi:ABC-type branched-subunit amino acid transport system substrate-binding protein
MPAGRISLAACLICLLPLACCNITELPSDPEKVRNPKFKIELLSGGSGSSGELGANAAMKTEKFKAISAYVDLEIETDPTSSDEAVRKAKDLRRDPSVLAVIGHSRSGTTRAALPYYAEAAIPVLMPAATSPYALYAFNESEARPDVKRLRRDPYVRFPNAFRMLPSDVPHQVDAIRAAAKKILGIDKFAESKQLDTIKGATRIMVICETTRRDGSDVYTKPMCDSLREDNDPWFSPLLFAYREIDLDTGDIWGVATEVFAVKPKLVILLGYPEFARNLLEELKERAPKHMRDYQFILPDACFVPDLADFGSEIYVTSPFNPSESLGCKSDEAQKLRDAVMENKQKKPTDEIFAFDAVLILAAVVKECEQSLNRQCIAETLERNHASLAGACQSYDIEAGERQNASYSVYAACGKELAPFWVVQKGEVRCDANWKCSKNCK